MFLTWPEVHGALTHFPIALLIAAAAFETGAILTRSDRLRNDWRTVSFWMMCGAVVMAVPALVTGYITGRELFGNGARPPEIFTWHWRAAVTTAVLASALLWWRIKTRDRLSSKARRGLVAALLLTVCVVATTGYLGGKMVFGDETDEPEGRSVGDVGGNTRSEQSQADADVDRETRDSEDEGESPADNDASRTAALPDAQLVAAGKKSYTEYRCQNCHRIEGEGRTTGPDLTRVGKRLPDVNWHIKHLKDPRSVDPDSSMPAYDQLSEEELKSIATYLASRK
jgi:uncharacterized membrane protein/mono/diheme cytochrome c family protein